MKSKIVRDLSQSERIKKAHVTQEQIDAVLKSLKDKMLEDLHNDGKFVWHGNFKLRIVRTMGYTQYAPDGSSFFVDDFNRVYITPAPEMKDTIENSIGVEDVGY